MHCIFTVFRELPKFLDSVNLENDPVVKRFYKWVNLYGLLFMCCNQFIALLNQLLNSSNWILSELFSRIKDHCKYRGMPGSDLHLHDDVMGDIEKQKQDEVLFYNKQMFHIHTDKKFFRRIDLNLYDVFVRKKLAPSFIRERFYCSNILFLTRIKRRKDMKILLKHFNGFK